MLLACQPYEASFFTWDAMRAGASAAMLSFVAVFGLQPVTVSVAGVYAVLYMNA
jgi:hypothetical protein